MSWHSIIRKANTEKPLGKETFVLDFEAENVEIQGMVGGAYVEWGLAGYVDKKRSGEYFSGLMIEVYRIKIQGVTWNEDEIEIGGFSFSAGDADTGGMAPAIVMPFFYAKGEKDLKKIKENGTKIMIKFNPLRDILPDRSVKKT